MARAVPIKIVKVSSNDSVPLIYLPKEATEMLDLKKGDKAFVYVDVANSRLIIEKAKAVKI
jgi:antitoxin component of MazEF toxin-antitoxin module